MTNPYHLDACRDLANELIRRVGQHVTLRMIGVNRREGNDSTAPHLDERDIKGEVVRVGGGTVVLDGQEFGDTKLYFVPLHQIQVLVVSRDPAESRPVSEG